MAPKTKQAKTNYKTRKAMPRVVKEARAEYTVASTPRQVILTEHPHIVRIPGVQNGDAIIRDKVVTVQHLVLMTHRFGQTPEQIAKEWNPHLSLAEIYDALSYYYDHQQEIDNIIAEDDHIEARAIRRFRYREQQNRKKEKAGANGRRN
ncbi:MAG: DUF433 domain-containing protein [Chloroflexi bacterium]|nr:DUF433 domain-containing protein [Chloroflexota bacterium]MBI5349347.1 DUF433 domain-containing protein [Chloroflexota bacterium]